MRDAADLDVRAADVTAALDDAFLGLLGSAVVVAPAADGIEVREGKAGRIDVDVAHRAGGRVAMLVKLFADGRYWFR